MDWNVLQECFRQQYSKFGSSREQYFHMHGDLFTMMKIQAHDRFIHSKSQTSSFITKLWGTRDIGVI